MSDDMQMLRDLGEVKAELSAVKAELAGLRERIDDVVISNLRDHGKRMSMLETRVAALEAAENRRAGGMAAGTSASVMGRTSTSSTTPSPIPPGAMSPSLIG